MRIAIMFVNSADSIIPLFIGGQISQQITLTFGGVAYTGIEHHVVDSTNADK